MECQPVATIPEVLAKVDLFQAFRTLFLLVYKVSNSVHYYYFHAGHAGLTYTRRSGVLRQLDEETRPHHS